MTNINELLKLNARANDGYQVRFTRVVAERAPVPPACRMPPVWCSLRRVRKVNSCICNTALWHVYWGMRWKTNHDLEHSEYLRIDRRAGKTGAPSVVFLRGYRTARVVGANVPPARPQLSPHLAKLVKFLARLVCGSASFVGSQPDKHAPREIGARHCDTWLELWKANCQCYLAPREALEIPKLAQMIGRGRQNIVVAQAQPEIPPASDLASIRLRPV